ncbi:MAG: SRPBCC family protein [Actinomycetota bacterium]|nr:SRPBCC family protein [Actinomycetota bacterium]
MARIQHSVEIERPPQEVFEVLTDLDRLPLWATMVVENHDLPDAPLRSGDSFRQTVRVAGVNLDTEWTVLEIEPPRQVRYEARAAGGGRLHMVQRVTEAGAGSRLEVDVDYDLPGGFLGEALDRVYVERRNQREAEHTLQNLKDLLESL